MALYLNSVLKLCLFADDTIIYGYNSDISQLITLNQSQLKTVLEWVKFNQQTVNCGKTKLMFSTNKLIKKCP